MKAGITGQTATPGEPIPLFAFRLDEGCYPGSIEVLGNDSPIQKAIFENLGANFNNQISVSIDKTPLADLYLGNALNMDAIQICSSDATISDLEPCQPVLNDSLLVAQTGNIPSGTYTSGGLIETSGKVVSMDSVILLAQDSILLKPGFNAVAGSFFRAAIEPCSAETANQEPVLFTAGNLPERPAVPLMAAYPNPFMGEAQVRVLLPQQSRIRILLNGQNGEQIMEILPSTLMDKGLHQFRLDARRLTPGAYYIVLEGPDFRIVEPLVYVRA